MLEARLPLGPPAPRSPSAGASRLVAAAHAGTRQRSVGGGDGPGAEFPLPPGSLGARTRLGHLHPRTGDQWFGFTAIQPEGLPPEIQLIPLGGHTEGHTGVAVRDGDRWLLHCGDAYYYHRELQHQREPHPLLDVVQVGSEIHHDLRLGTRARLRELLHDHGDEVTVFCAHDPWELAAHQDRADGRESLPTAWPGASGSGASRPIGAVVWT
ncbi:hypothetical protein OG342_39325 [Streptomyces bobili]|uniref:hypothetical protein n=1 Tax=Streptomyces bobili TaxID=67280 RepID=UPI002254130F|nr:hypothetical protein [Streptomyces bobili]MCX5528833.1 hypothetical protein [Streptomyces bobili]